MTRIDVVIKDGVVFDKDTQERLMESMPNWADGEGTLHISVKCKRYYDKVHSVGEIPWTPMYVAYTPRGGKFKTPKRIKTWNE